MTYYCGTGARLSLGVGIPAQPPFIECDKCKAKVWGETKSGHMAAWLRNDRAPRGWLRVRVIGTDSTPFFRRDYCKACRPSVTK